MKVLKIVVIAIAIILGLFILVGLFLPSSMSIEKSIVIDTPPNVPYSQVTNLRNMPKWDPWSNIDSTMETTYDGPIAGLGAKRSWKSTSDQVGTGSMTITKDDPFTFVEAELDFGDQGLANSYYKFEEIEPGKTKVTWGFNSDIEIPIFGGYLAMMMGPMVEKEYVKGLESLKKLSESIENKLDVSDKKFSIEEVESSNVICISTKTVPTDNNLSEKMAKAYGQLVTNIQVNGMEMSGPPITITTKWEENEYEFDNCIPIENLKGDLSAGVFKTETYSGTAIKVEHVGSYANMNNSYDVILAYISQLGLEIVGNPWEVYISDPSNTPEDKLLTNIYFPVK
ncbi:MAG: SRPBCC family protein [Candidatus Kapaibacterium sp.]|nr:SRPBCC family protein [Ignavibacteriota bacterium]MCB9220213.1 SRPBCC family protein [Ignavibacteria bacterium]